MTGTIHILFFGSLAEALQHHSESFELNQAEISLSQLRSHLAERGGHWHMLLDSTIKSAVNHQVVSGDCALSDTDEVAFFPPVTGG